MQSPVDTQGLARGQQALDATSVDPLERSEEAWFTALSQAVFERLPNSLSFELEETNTRHSGPEAAAAANLESENSQRTRGVSTSAGAKRPEGPTQLSTEVQVGNLGRVAVQVSRTLQGLNIVINVADARVKSLLTSELHVLLDSLKNTGLPVNSVRIETGSQAGPALALDRLRPKGSNFHKPSQARLKAYQGASQDEEPEAGDESINLTV